MKSFPYTAKTEYDINGNVTYDRFVTADMERAANKRLFTNGVYANPLGFGQTAGEGMSVILSAGGGIIQGLKFEEENERTMVFEASESLPRYDLVVIRLNDELGYRDTDLYVVKGTSATTPAVPALTRNEVTYELCVCQVFIPANSTGITDERITDTRLLTDVCGTVTQAIDSVDTTTIFNQLQSQVDDNIALIQSAIDETTAGNLQLQIDENETAIEVVDAKVDTNASNIAQNASDIADNVITSGSNESGSWTKFPDGTIVVFGSFREVTTAGGGFGVTFPAGASVLLTNRHCDIMFTSSQLYYALRYTSGDTLTTAYFIAYEYSTNTTVYNTLANGSYIVHGRWK